MSSVLIRSSRDIGLSLDAGLVGLSLDVIEVLNGLTVGPSGLVRSELTVSELVNDNAGRCQFGVFEASTLSGLTGLSVIAVSILSELDDSAVNFSCVRSVIDTSVGLGVYCELT